MVAPRALAPVDPGPVTVMVVVGVELTHYRLASWSHPSQRRESDVGRLSVLEQECHRVAGVMLGPQVVAGM